VKILHSDGGGEYTSHALVNFLIEKGIKHELTTPYTPQHNGVAECMNCTLLDKVSAMLLMPTYQKVTSTTPSNMLPSFITCLPLAL
jgi:transposase InsO family protein